MLHRIRRWTMVAALAAALAAPAHGAGAESLVARGKYLVTIGGCTDCHTPGHLLGHPDMTRYLGGSDVGFAIPGQGVFVGSEPDAGQEDRARHLDDGADRHRHHHRRAPGRADPGADHAVAWASRT